MTTDLKKLFNRRVTFLLGFKPLRVEYALAHRKGKDPYKIQYFKYLKDVKYIMARVPYDYHNAEHKISYHTWLLKKRGKTLSRQAKRDIIMQIRRDNGGVANNILLLFNKFPIKLKFSFNLGRKKK